MMEKSDKIEKLAEVYRSKGLEALDNKEMVKASRFLQEAIHLYQRCGNDYMYASCLNLLGVTYANAGDEAMAVDCYLKGLECAVDKRLDGIISLFYNNLGSRYQELGQHKKAIYYFELAMEKQQCDLARAEDKYLLRNMIYTLNLAFSFRKLNHMEEARNYMEEVERLMEQCPREDLRLPLLTLKCSIFWCLGEREFVQNNLDELLMLAKKHDITADYVQNVQEAAELFMEIQDYDRFQVLLMGVEEAAILQNSVYFHLVSVEMWMNYYSITGEIEKYNGLCIRHASLCREQKEIHDKEQVLALDIKIALHEKEEERKAAEAKSRTDVLTGIPNRYSLEQDSKKLVEKAAKEGKMIGVGILDIDCFKEVNDTYGHNEGDRSLKKLAQILCRSVEGYGKVYRFGGDEFVILIPEGDYEVTAGLGERICEDLEKAGIRNENSYIGKSLTVSQGYACFHPDSKEGLAGLLEHADLALYEVKKSGRNGYRIILEESED